MGASTWDAVVRRAHRSGGVVGPATLGGHPGRTARRRGLEQVQPRAYVALTQPRDVPTLLAAVHQSVTGSYAVLGWGALWLHGLAPQPPELVVGVPSRTRFRARPPVVVRRLAPSVLRGSRTLAGVSVVALEVALLQAVADDPTRAASCVEQALRDRRTTVPRLRSRCGRGIKGSTALRQILDELVGASLDVVVRNLQAALERRGLDGLRVEVRFESAGGASAYADLLDEQGATAVEVDGFLSHTERARFRADRRRDRWLHAEHGVLTLRVDVAEAIEDVDRLADELAPAMLARRSAARRTAS